MYHFKAEMKRSKPFRKLLRIDQEQITTDKLLAWAASNICHTLRVIAEQKKLCGRAGVLVLAVFSKQDPMPLRCIVNQVNQWELSAEVCPASFVECQ